MCVHVSVMCMHICTWIGVPKSVDDDGSENDQACAVYLSQGVWYAIA